jgi:hypothetical protein
MAERLNFREAVARAGVSRQRLNEAIRSGHLPAERGGGPGKPTYIHLEDLQVWCVSQGLAMPVEALEQGITQALAQLRTPAPLERSETSPEVSKTPTLNREEIIDRIRHAKDVEGKSYQYIADELNAARIPTFSGKGQWQKGNVERFYKGKQD